MNRWCMVVLLMAAIGLESAQDRPPAPLQNVGIDQRLDAQLPLDATFRDENGKTVRLGDYFGKKPVILVLAYYQCPMLCTLVVSGLASAMRNMSFDAGDQYLALTVSFNPRETPEMAAAAQRDYLKQYGRAGGEQGWHFLTGAAPDIERVTRAAGFRYAWDEASQQYAHGSGIMVATPEGKLARYFYGIEFSPRDLRFALVEASRHKIGSPVDAVLLYCFHYDAATAKYGLVITRVLQLAGLVAVAAILLLVLLMVRRDRRARHVGPGALSDKPLS